MTASSEARHGHGILQLPQASAALVHQQAALSTAAVLAAITTDSRSIPGVIPAPPDTAVASQARPVSNSSSALPQPSARPTLIGMSASQAHAAEHQQDLQEQQPHQSQQPPAFAIRSTETASPATREAQQQLLRVPNTTVTGDASSSVPVVASTATSTQQQQAQTQMQLPTSASTSASTVNLAPAAATAATSAPATTTAVLPSVPGNTPGTVSITVPRPPSTFASTSTSWSSSASPYAAMPPPLPGSYPCAFQQAPVAMAFPQACTINAPFGVPAMVPTSHRLEYHHPQPTLPFYFHAKQRSGKWTSEEEKYADLLIKHFEQGLMNEKNGSTLRSFLSRKLHCAPMRISKKYAGKGIGKMVFVAKDAMRPQRNTAMTSAQIAESTRMLRQAEITFYRSAFPELTAPYLFGDPQRGQRQQQHHHQQQHYAIPQHQPQHHHQHHPYQQFHPHHQQHQYQSYCQPQQQQMVLRTMQSSVLPKPNQLAVGSLSLLLPAPSSVASSAPASVPTQNTNGVAMQSNTASAVLPAQNQSLYNAKETVPALQSSLTPQHSHFSPILPNAVSSATEAQPSLNGGMMTLVPPTHHYAQAQQLVQYMYTNATASKGSLSQTPGLPQPTPSMLGDTVAAQLHQTYLSAVRQKEHGEKHPQNTRQGEQGQEGDERGMNCNLQVNEATAVGKMSEGHQSLRMKTQEVQNNENSAKREGQGGGEDDEFSDVDVYIDDDDDEEDEEGDDDDEHSLAFAFSSNFIEDDASTNATPVMRNTSLRRRVDNFSILPKLHSSFNSQPTLLKPLGTAIAAAATPTSPRHRPIKSCFVQHCHTLENDLPGRQVSTSSIPRGADDYVIFAQQSAREVSLHSAYMPATASVTLPAPITSLQEEQQQQSEKMLGAAQFFTTIQSLHEVSEVSNSSSDGSGNDDGGSMTAHIFSDNTSNDSDDSISDCSHSKRTKSRPSLEGRVMKRRRRANAIGIGGSTAAN